MITRFCWWPGPGTGFVWIQDLKTGIEHARSYTFNEASSLCNWLNERENW